MSYRDILRGAELKAEYDKYQTWLAKDRAAKQTLYKGLNVSKFTYTTQLAYVAPFGQPNKTVFVEVEICAAATPSPGSVALNLAGSYFTTIKPSGAGDSILDTTVFPKKKLAKMIVKQRVTTATEDSTSRITGRSYKRHATNSVSVFLGKNAATDDFSDAVKAIKGLSGYETFITTKGNTISFVPEG